MATRTALVTGGAGFIGSHIVDALVARGDRVRVLDNFSTGRRQNLASVADRIEVIEADIADAQAVAKAVAGVDVVFHQAALASVQLSVEHPLNTNHACATGTLTLLEAAQKAGVRRVVYAGSSSAYGNSAFSSNRETDLPAPRSTYAAAKLAAEYYCQAFYHTHGLETVTLRYFNVFGPRQDPGSPYSAVIPLFITAMLANRSPTVFGDGQQTRDFAYVGNVVRGNLLAAEAPNVAGQAFNLANGKSTSLLSLLEALNQLLKTNVQPILAPPRPGDVRDSLADISETRRKLGYEPLIGLEEGLRLSIDYYRSTIRR